MPCTCSCSANGEATAVSGKLEYKEVEQWTKQQYAP